MDLSKYYNNIKYYDNSGTMVQWYHYLLPLIAGYIYAQ